MSLEITHREQQGIDILALKGQLTFGPEDLELNKELDDLMEAGKFNIVFDLSHLSQLDDTGLATMLTAREKLMNIGGNIAVFSAAPLQIVPDIEGQLKTSVPVFETEQDAIDSFFPDTEIKHYDVLELVQSFKMNNPKP
jgi:anti-sigma B factor antagonist